MRDDDVVETAAMSATSGMADLSGTTVAGRYRLEGPLGQGSMANVYRAVDERLDRDVAVKLFHTGQNGAARARFAAEAQALARLSHPGLISIFDVGTTWQRPYLVMQLVDGGSLRDRLLDGPLAPEEVVALGTRLALALAHVHHNGIVHRDIKPSNIVLDAQGAPHLADFGIALLLDAARMTSSNEIMGTAAYLSPEQIMGTEVGASADIYSLGLVLLECLTGELEYPGASKVESALARLHRQPRIPTGLAPVLTKLLTAMTARDPADRPAAKECAAWFVAVREHRALSGRTARLLAANWLARKTRQFGRSRATGPLFSGWRRFAIAGSGLAMAIFASAFLFTTLLPKVMPDLPNFGGDSQQQMSTSGSASSRMLEQPDRTAMHIVAALNGHGKGSSSAQPTTTTTPGTPGTTTATPPDQLADGPAGGTSAGLMSGGPSLQDSSSVDDFPVNSTSDTPPPAPSTTTTSSGNAPNTGDATTNTTTGDTASSSASGNAVPGNTSSGNAKAADGQHAAQGKSKAANES